MQYFPFFCLVIIALCESATSNTFIFYYNFISELGFQMSSSSVFPVATGEPPQLLADPNIQEDFPDYNPPLTAAGTFAPPPPPPPPPPMSSPLPPPSLPAGPYQPTITLSPFFPYTFQSFSYFSYTTPNQLFFFMCV